MTKKVAHLVTMAREQKCHHRFENPALEPILHIEIARPTAKVLLKRPFRDAAYIRTHVSYVVKESAEQGEQHIIRNLLSIRRKLDEMELDREIIEREMREIEAAVRAELWRQILTPEVN